MNHVFWDSNLFIYLIEAVSPFDQQVAEVVKILRQNRLQVVTSALTVCEVLVKPVREQRNDLILKCKQTFSNIGILPITQDIADAFAYWRAHHPIKTPDALQLACAQLSGAKIMITNDERLSRFSTQDLTVFSLQSFLDTQRPSESDSHDDFV